MKKYVCLAAALLLGETLGIYSATYNYEKGQYPVVMAKEEAVKKEVIKGQLKKIINDLDDEIERVSKDLQKLEGLEKKKKRSTSAPKVSIS